MNRLDPKLLILVGATVVAGLLGARSLMVPGPTGDNGFGGEQPLPLGAAIDDSPPVDFDPPPTPRNPFADARATPFGDSSFDADADLADVDNDESTDTEPIAP